MITIRDIREMNKQQACDYSMKSLILQGEPCLNKDGNCVYSNGSMKCPIGFLLPVKCKLMTKQKGDDTPIDLAIDSGVLDIPLILKEHTQIFQVLQNFHDAYNNISKLKEQLEKLGDLGINVNKKHYTKWLNLCQKKYNTN